MVYMDLTNRYRSTLLRHKSINVESLEKMELLDYYAWHGGMRMTSLQNLIDA